MYLTLTIDGRKVHSIENTNPKAFTNVTVFAGDNLKPAADASYRNLLWESFLVGHSFQIGTKVMDKYSKNLDIGTIDNWGPFFRVSFDLIIHSHGKNDCHSVLALKAKTDCFQDGDRIPAILVCKNIRTYLEFVYSVINNQKFMFKTNFKFKTWYKIVIEKKAVKGKVRSILHFLHLSQLKDILIIIRLILLLQLMGKKFIAFHFLIPRPSIM